MIIAGKQRLVSLSRSCIMCCSGQSNKCMIFYALFDHKGVKSAYTNAYAAVKMCIQDSLSIHTFHSTQIEDDDEMMSNKKVSHENIIIAHKKVVEYR